MSVQEKIEKTVKVKLEAWRKVHPGATEEQVAEVAWYLRRDAGKALGVDIR